MLTALEPIRQSGQLVARRLVEPAVPSASSF
jgi:hypothetical protein